MHPYSSHLISLQSRNIKVNVFTAYKSTDYVLLQTAHALLSMHFLLLY